MTSYQELKLILTISFYVIKTTKFYILIFIEFPFEIYFSAYEHIILIYFYLSYFILIKILNIFSHFVADY